MSLATTAFAANPFDIVPINNWTYGAIENLVQAGVFAEYKDLHFSKTQPLTRYELATYVAKARVHEKQATVGQKAVIDKLAAEFTEELTHTAVAANHDQTQISGQYRIRYQHDSLYPSVRKLQGKFEIDAAMPVNDDWNINVTGECYRNFYSDEGYQNGTNSSALGTGKKIIVKDTKGDTIGTSVLLPTGGFDITNANIQGKIGDVAVTVGKFANTVGSGLMFDDYVSGVAVQFGNKVKAKLAYSEADSNISGSAPSDSYMASMNKVANADFSYDLDEATTVGASIQKWMSKTSGVDSVNVYDLSVTSKLDDDFSSYASLAKTGANDDNKAYVIGLKYKDANKNQVGSYGAWIDYENFQQNTVIDTTDWMSAGQHGIALGVNYTPAKNIKWSNVFLHATALGKNNLGQAGGQTENFFRTQMCYYF